MQAKFHLPFPSKKMPQSLLKFSCWLIDEKAYKAASEPYTVPIDKIRKILGITELIVSLSKHTFTPFSFGLCFYDLFLFIDFATACSYSFIFLFYFFLLLFIYIRIIICQVNFVCKKFLYMVCRQPPFKKTCNSQSNFKINMKLVYKCLPLILH